MIKLVVFDFDGTLGDSAQVTLDVINDLAERYKFDKIDGTAEVKNMDIPEAINILHVNRLKIPFMARTMLKELEKRTDGVKLYPDIEKMIVELGKKYKLAILTSNKAKTVQKILANTNIKYSFEFIQRGSFFGKHKKIKKILKKNGLKAEEMIYVGDQVRDITASHKAGVKIIAVSWGFNSGDVLEEHNPEYIADKPMDLVKILK